MKLHPITLGSLLLLSPAGLRAGCCLHETSAETFTSARAIGDYRVSSRSAFRDEAGRIHTRYVLTRNDQLKGEAPAELEFSTPGGTIGGERDFSSQGLDLRPGKDYILHLEHAPDGTWQPLPFRALANSGNGAQRRELRDFIRGGARGKAPSVSQDPVSDEIPDQGYSGVPGSRITTTGYSENSGVPARLVTCDTGNPIPCLVDIDPAKLPSGTNTAQALQIVQDALDAWSEVSSLKFRIEGTTSFGMSASSVNLADGKLRIQLHDNFNAIGSTSTLGVGGGSTTIDPGYGATIAGRTFNRLDKRYVVLNHRSSSLSNALTFAEVLTHEIGHALGLVHSSENPNEPDAILKDATMYHTAHADGRGADIRVYDEDRILFGYPLNTPPASTDRVLRVVTGSPQPTGFGVDRISIQGIDLQTPGALSYALTSVSTTGFTLSGNTLSFASPAYGDALLSDAQIAGGTYYEKAHFQISDGVNLSPTYKLVISGYHHDSQPSDGLPNSWLSTYFGTTSPGTPGSPRHPDSDPDGDGFDNRTERYLGTHPLDPASGPPVLDFNLAARTLTFTPVRFAPYSIESSATLGNWARRQAVATFATPTPVVIDLSDDAGAACMFYRATVSP